MTQTSEREQDFLDIDEGMDVEGAETQTDDLEDITDDTDNSLEGIDDAAEETPPGIQSDAVTWELHELGERRSPEEQAAIARFRREQGLADESVLTVAEQPVDEPEPASVDPDLEDIQIEEGIPLPPVTGFGMGRPSVWPERFKKMKVGDSVLLKDQQTKNLGHLRTAAKKAKRMIAMRKVEGGVRIWVTK